MDGSGESWVDERGVSPVVGGVFILGIVVVLAGVLLFMANGFGGDTDPVPEASLDVENGSGSYEYVLEHRGGDALGDGDGRVVIEGVANATALQATELRASQSIELTPVDDTIRLVYHTETGESYVLQTFEVDPVPASPDEGCDWVKSETNGGTDPVTIDGIVVNCDVETSGDVTVKNDGAVIGEVDGERVTLDGDGYGDVDADGDVVMKPDSTVDGSVDADGDLSVKDGSTIAGSVDADGEVLVKTNSTVEGSLAANGIVNVNDEATIEGSVDTDDNVNVKTVSTVEGSVDTDGELKVEDGSSVEGSVDAGERVTLGSESTVDSSVETDDEVELGGDSTVDGRVDAGGIVTLKDGSTVAGSVVADGDVVLKPDSTVDGDVVGDDVKLTDATVATDVYVGGSFECSSSTVDGEDCDDYSAKDAGDYDLVARDPFAPGVDRRAVAAA